MHEDEVAAFDEGLRLMLAFYCIMEPEKRAIVAALVEKYADPLRLQEAANQSSGVGSELIADLRKFMHQSELLLQQRQYAQHLRALQFSIVEDAVDRMGLRSALR